MAKVAGFFMRKTFHILVVNKFDQKMTVQKPRRAMIAYKDLIYRLSMEAIYEVLFF